MNKSTFAVFLAVLMIFVGALPLAFSHSANESEVHQAPEDLEAIDPLWYFQHGSPWYGLVTIVFWYIIIRGVYALGIIVLGRFVVSSKPKARKK